MVKAILANLQTNCQYIQQESREDLEAAMLCGCSKSQNTLELQSLNSNFSGRISFVR